VTELPVGAGLADLASRGGSGGRPRGERAVAAAVRRAAAEPDRGTPADSSTVGGRPPRVLRADRVGGLPAAALASYSATLDHHGSWAYDPRTGTSGTRRRRRLAAIPFSARGGSSAGTATSGSGGPGGADHHYAAGATATGGGSGGLAPCGVRRGCRGGGAALVGWCPLGWNNEPVFGFGLGRAGYGSPYSQPARHGSGWTCCRRSTSGRRRGPRGTPSTFGRSATRPRSAFVGSGCRPARGPRRTRARWPAVEVRRERCRSWARRPSRTPAVAPGRAAVHRAPPRPPPMCFPGTARRRSAARATGSPCATGSRGRGPARASGWAGPDAGAATRSPACALGAHARALRRAARGGTGGRSRRLGPGSGRVTGSDTRVVAREQERPAPWGVGRDAGGAHRARRRRRARGHNPGSPARSAAALQVRRRPGRRPAQGRGDRGAAHGRSSGGSLRRRRQASRVARLPATVAGPRAGARVARVVVRIARQPLSRTVVVVRSGAVAACSSSNAADLRRFRRSTTTPQHDLTRVARDGRVVGEFAVERRVVGGLRPRSRRCSVRPFSRRRTRGFGARPPQRPAHRRGPAQGVAERRKGGGRGARSRKQARPNLSSTQEKTWERKIKEALLAIQIEKRYTKTEIFTLYANRSTSVTGRLRVEAASRLYFPSRRRRWPSRRPPRRGIIQSPNRQVRTSTQTARSAGATSAVAHWPRSAT